MWTTRSFIILGITNKNKVCEVAYDRTIGLGARELHSGVYARRSPRQPCSNWARKYANLTGLSFVTQGAGKTFADTTVPFELFQKRLVHFPVTRGLRDFRGALERFPLWRLLAFFDLQRGHARTRLGIFWHSLSFFLVVAALGYMYSAIFGRPRDLYVPYLAAGFLAWRFISLVIVDALQVFIRYRGFLTQIPMPMTVFVFRNACYHFYLLGLNAIAFVAILFAFGIVPEPDPLLLPLGVGLLATTAVGVTTLLAIAGVFLPWTQSLLPPIVNLTFFVTPILWMPGMLVGFGEVGVGAGLDTSTDARSAIVMWNPIYHMIEVVRGPLIGYQIAQVSWWFASAICALTLIGGIFLLDRTKSRVMIKL